MNEPFTCLETAELEQTALPKRWVWDGYLAPGQITVFTSVWKSGKTTLLSHLLAQRKAVGALAGRAVAAGNSVVISEEPPNLWHERHARLGFGPGNCFLCRPFVGNPSSVEWSALIDFIKAQREPRSLDLAVFDPLSYFLPMGEENHPRLLLAALTPLHELTRQGMAVLLMHHPRKARAAEGMLSRGSGMLSAFADILIEMYRVRPDDVNDRRRRLVAFSRDADTPGSLVIELNSDGSAFAVREDAPDDDEFRENWVPLRMIFENAEQELTRQQIRRAWPASFPAPSRNTLWRWLNQALERGLIRRDGTGLRGQPFRYFLPEKQAIWHRQKPAASADQEELDNSGWMIGRRAAPTPGGVGGGR